ncbi:MAG: altronate dehydratase family protein [Candidatus Cellulosilyticum pullistercoris]|uniref:Altronate dehydratase family protein n=1 Tax=Candidatus Cellulosilyticum pullistercoris TaxID=2838521 RepID=A0A9E2NNB3_9FIRM|nr:altronate dehydratase family protein [Candidatus Cellulosilyticum pullistercoris]
MLNFLKINELDNVEVALKESDGIPAGHKRALKAIKKGEPIIKYGNPIGIATADIAEGEWVHIHNLKTGLGDLLEYTYEPEVKPLAEQKTATFMGYKRLDGKVGIRNEVWIIPTVGCVNNIAQIIERKSQDLIKGSVEGIHAFAHPYGCSQLGEDHLNTQKALAGLINHPNAGAVLVLGLGCENNTIDGLKQVIGDYDENRVKFIVCQEHEDEVAVALEVLAGLVDFAAGFTREEVPASELVIGLKCGGSDGFSGITANPLVGAISDKLISQGGTSMLTEVPEMFGAETLLMKRCVNEEVFNKTVSLINNFKTYFIKHDQVVYENPSPGNKKGGISTLEDKSLGCTQKGGSAPVVDVLTYGEPVKTKGLNLLQGPGNDLVAATALSVSGAHIVLFTTGRGTPFGAPVPTVKISSNNELYAKKKNWIDFNAGQLLSGKTMDEVSTEFYNYILDLASGRIQSKNEEQGIRDLAIFKDGVTL